MKINLLIFLFTIVVGIQGFGQQFAGTSFEEPTTVSNTRYVDTGDPSVDHDLVNNAGQPPVDFTSLGGEIGFDAFFFTAGNNDGLCDPDASGVCQGDFFGVTDFTGVVSAFIDGTQGYLFQDGDGTVVLTFDEVTLQGVAPTLQLFYFLRSTGWETSDSLVIWVELTGGAQSRIDLLNTKGSDIDDLSIEGSWIELSQNLTGYTTATLKVSFTSNASDEALYLDNIAFSNGGIQPKCNISDDQLTVSTCDPLTNEFTIEINPLGTGLSAIGYSYFLSINGGSPMNGSGTYGTPIVFGPYQSDGLTTYDITITDNDDANCTFMSNQVIAPENCLATPCESVDLVITAVFDGPLTGGLPKGVEIYVINDIADISNYGIGSANNGGGTNGVEFTFPNNSFMAGDFFYVASDSTGFFNFFGFYPQFTTTAMSINGDDAIELFCNGLVIDVFGDINTDGTGEAWEYMDGWAYRVNETGPDGSTFVIDNWIFSGVNSLDNQTTNASATMPVPIGTYLPMPGNNDCPENLSFQNETVAGGVYQTASNAGTGVIETLLGGSGVTVASGTTVTFDAGTSIVLRPGFTAKAGSTFTATIGGCTSARVRQNQEVVEPRGVALNEGFEMNIYPNPTSGFTNISIELSSNEEVSIQIFDLNGRLIQHVALPQLLSEGTYNFEVDASTFSKGLYVSKVSVGGKFLMKKILVQ